ncbi:TPA: RnfH family protein [Legionella pneumophila]|nr:RnfH family protein [Legionella pneumophila]HAT8917367.1 RnfH family protein [Legionella pneumophila subsp. pneumophila]MDI9845355.1 RnfH family protein [Legionella pneumophila]HAU0605649.1 RnfH family protein [Legionella pneumophila]HAU0831924.1 RnfH family protein [Legionella pneumophila]HAU0840481.1 RnfH family protein [Legionella pneumophila]
MVKVELVYIANSKNCLHYKMDLKQGATVEDALIESNIYSTCPETRELPVGVYGKRVSVDQVLKEGDRIEIYRPLILDPKEKRRKLAQFKK